MKQTPNNQPCTTSRHSIVSRHSREGGNLVNNAQKPNINTLITENLDIWTTAIKSKSRTGRGSNKTYELYGIKKLRALILDLAVRGLLVPQDPNDEPASELLKKIKAEKEALIKAGKIKKQKVLPEIAGSDKPFELPSGWEFIRLQDITNIITKGSSPKWQGISYTDKPSDVLFVTSENVGAFSLLLNKKKYVEQKFNEIQPRSILEFGDILMNIVGASIGRTAIYDIHDIANINQAVCLIRVLNNFLESNFLLKFFNSNICISYMYDKQVDNARPNLSMSNISKFIIPIPPLKEQKSIVAKVDELMALCDQLEQQTDTSIKAHKLLVENLLNALTQAKDHKTFHEAWQRIAKHFDTLFTTEHSIDQLKQTILQLAVMGKLVKQDPNDEPASELLKKIAKEKEKLINEGKIKKQKPLPEISEEEKPFELPEGWEWVRFGKLVNFKAELVRPDLFQDYDQIGPDSIEKGTGKLLIRRTVEESGIKGPNSKFYKGQLLYSKIRPSLSKAIIAEFDGLCSADMYPLETMINSQYLLKVMLSEPFLVQVRISENRIKMPKLNIESLSNIIVPLAPENIQRNIVEVIGSNDQICSTLIQNLKTQQTTINRLADVVGRNMAN